MMNHFSAKNNKFLYDSVYWAKCVRYNMQSGQIKIYTTHRDGGLALAAVRKLIYAHVFLVCDEFLKMTSQK